MKSKLPTTTAADPAAGLIDYAAWHARLETLAPAARAAEIKRAEELITGGVLEIGKALASFKRAVKAGVFTDALAGAGWNDRTARMYMRTAEVFAGGRHAAWVAQIGVAKLDIIAAAAPAAAAELANTGKLGEWKVDDLAEMSKRQLKLSLAEQDSDLAAENRRLKNLYQNAQRQNRQQKKAAAAGAPGRGEWIERLTTACAYGERFTAEVLSVAEEMQASATAADADAVIEACDKRLTDTIRRMNNHAGKAKAEIRNAAGEVLTTDN